MSIKEKTAILFVDDEEKALKYFRLAFAKDFDIHIAGSVDTALDILQELGDDIGVLITDQRMPGRQGVDLLKQARRDWPNIVRILTTAYSDLEDAIAAVNRGEILRYITKPWDLNDLRAELHHAMDFYLLRRERDLLMNEKLGVRRHLQTADRLRNFLALSSGLLPLRHTAYALAAWVMDSREAQQARSTPDSDLELWGLEVRQTAELMRLNQRLQDLKKTADMGFSARIDLAQDLNMDAGREISGAPRLISKLLHILRNLQSGTGIRLYDADSGPRLELELPKPDLGDDSPLLEAYLIAWHHGGSLRVREGRLQLDLPTDPLSVELPPPDDKWLESRYLRLEL